MFGNQITQVIGRLTGVVVLLIDAHLCKTFGALYAYLSIMIMFMALQFRASDMKAFLVKHKQHFIFLTLNNQTQFYLFA